MACEGCQGNGYRIAERSEDGLLAVERCDTCNQFTSDEAARNHVHFTMGLLPYWVNTEPDAPCYLTVNLLGRRYRLSTGGIP